MEDDEIPAFFGMRSSPHEVGLPDLLAVTRLRGTRPPEIVVLGMQPGVIELGWDLSAEVVAKLDRLVDGADQPSGVSHINRTPFQGSCQLQAPLT